MDKELAMFAELMANEEGPWSDYSKLVKRGDVYIIIDEPMGVLGREYTEYTVTRNEAVEWLADGQEDAGSPFALLTVTADGIEEFPKELIDLGFVVELASRSIVENGEERYETLHAQRDRDGVGKFMLTTCAVSFTIDDYLTGIQAREWVSEAMQSDSFKYTAALNVCLFDVRNVNLNKPIKHTIDIDRKEIKL